MSNSTMNREKVLETITAVETRMSELSNAEAPVFKTAGKYLEKIGYISEIDNVKDIVKANKIVNDLSGGFDDAAKELDLGELEIEKPTIMGHPIESWKADIVTQLQVLKDDAEYESLKKAKKVLSKHLSADDIFARDMESIASITEKVKK